MITELLKYLIYSCIDFIPKYRQLSSLKKEAIFRRYGKSVHLSNVRPKSFDTIGIRDVAFTDHSKKIMISMSEVKLQLGFDYRTFKPFLKKVSAHHVAISLLQEEDCPPASSVPNKTSEKAKSKDHNEVIKSLYVKLANLLYKLGNVSMRSLRCTTLSFVNSDRLQLTVKELSLAKKNHRQKCRLTLDAGELMMSSGNSSLATTSEAKFQILVNGNEQSFSSCQLAGSCENFSINASQIAEGLLSGQSAAFDLTFTSNNNSFAIEKPSWATFNRINVSLWGAHTFAPTGKVELHVSSSPFSMEDLASSFPSQLSALLCQDFSGTSSMNLSLGFEINNVMANHFDVDFEHDLTFEAKSGTDLGYLSGIFKHTVDPSRSGGDEIVITLDEGSETFTPLDRIAPVFLKTIVLTEDPNFQFHSGVDIRLLGNAIMINLSSRSFRRGGSTISMQLARNLFLNHHKNLVRKLDEVLYTFLIENIFKISKNRILEIYLNIIEFGPGIYGIGAASEYYFGKQPALLTLQESLTLTYIIPRPKFFLDALIKESPQLKTNFRRHIDLYSKLIQNSGIAEQAELQELYRPITFSKLSNPLTF